MRRLVQSLNYFFYIAFHHGPVLAIKLLVDERRGEKKYGLDTTDVLVMKELQSKAPNAVHSNEYMPASYILMEKTFAEVNKFDHNKTFLDIGCGTGRALFVAAANGFTKISGIELYAPYCKLVEKYIISKQSEYPAATISVIGADAATYQIPDNIQTIFFYNPFDEYIMDKVLQHILASLKRSPRRLFVVYLSPIYKSRFLEYGFEEIFHAKRFNYIEASVLKKEL